MITDQHQLPEFRTPVWVPLVLFAVLAYFPLFLHLDTLPLRIWDEARQALNAYDMWKNGNYLVTYFNGEPDMWSTKPPLLIWAQTLLFHLIGPGELAVRLPATFAAFLVAWFMLRAIQKTTQELWLGFMAAMVLVTSEGFLDMHMARTGDYDTPVMLFMTLSMWTLYRWIHTEKQKELLLFFLFLTLGVLTKSVQALLFLPGLFIFLIWQGKLVRLLKARNTWIGLAFFLIVIGGFYLARELENPGYLKAVSENELGGRYLKVLEEHRHPWDFYVKDLISYRITTWWILVPIGIMVGLVQRNDRIRVLTRLMVCVGSFYLFVISSAGTKLTWYSGPLFPICAVLVAVTLYVPFTWLMTEQWSAGSLRTRILPCAFLFVVFIRPYSTVVGRSYFPEEWPWEVAITAPIKFLQDAVRHKRVLDLDVVCYENYNAHLLFYAKLLTDDGRPLRLISKKDLGPGQRVLAIDWPVMEYIETHFDFELLRMEGEMRFYEILEPRDEGHVIGPAE